MKELANRLAMQHLVNAYSQETGKGILLEKYQQNSSQLTFSQGLTLLCIPLDCIQSQLFVPLSYVSLVGRHRLADLPYVFKKDRNSHLVSPRSRVYCLNSSYKSQVIHWMLHHY
jgi:hypothetical protein